jgi:ABC-2 type transport system permease protein
LPSRSVAFRWLLRKEWRALLASRAWWMLLALAGPLVGVSFIRAVRIFGEASAGAVTGGGEAFNLLDGIWAPSFGAYEIAAVFLLPFVAISVVSGDRQSGALKLELQQSLSPLFRVFAKAAVMAIAWAITGGAALIAFLLWRSYGGSAYAPEIVTLAAGHLLNGSVTIALAMAAASMTSHPSTAAIVTLAITVGTWIVAFVAAVNGGVWQQLAAYTPTALVSMFQHGLVRLDVVLVAAVIVATGFSLAAVWTPLGLSPGRRAAKAAIVMMTAVLCLGASGWVRASWDVSENRRNSFAPADQRMIEQLSQPLRIEVHLAAQDPRRADLEHQALAKLRRVKPDVEVTYVARTSIGLWEQADPGYGEIRYELGGRRAMSRATTADGVLEIIAELAGVAREEPDPASYLGHPLEAQPARAAWIFYLVWPAVVAGAFMYFGRQT